MSDAVFVALISGTVTVVSVFLARVWSHQEHLKALRLLRHQDQVLGHRLDALSRRLEQLEHPLEPPLDPGPPH